MGEDLTGAGREKFFAFGYLLLFANTLPNFIGTAVHERGGLGAFLALYDVSAIVWLAVAAGIALLWRSAEGQGARRGDWLAAGLVALAALAPTPVASSMGMTALALWGMATSARASHLWRASAIFLSITAFLLWGRACLAWAAGPLLSADARFVAWISGMTSQGNLVAFSGGGQFAVAPGCSSLHGISLALILWTAAVQYFALRVTLRLWLTLAAAVLASILVNGIRLSVIALRPADFDYWHTGSGGQSFGWVALIAVVAVVYAGIRRGQDLG